MKKRNAAYACLMIFAGISLVLAGIWFVFSSLNEIEINLYRIGYFGYSESMVIYLQFFAIPLLAVIASVGRLVKKGFLYIIPMVLMLFCYLARMGGYVLFYKEERLDILDVNTFASNFYYIFIAIMFLTALAVFLSFIGGKTVITANGIFSKIVTIAGIVIYGFLTLSFLILALINLSNSNTVNSVFSLMSFSVDLFMFIWLFFYFRIDTKERMDDIIEYKELIEKKAEKPETLDME